MITTMMGVIIVIIILVLLMILVLKMTKKYHITWYWCQNIRDSYMVKKGKKNTGRGLPSPFWAMSERKHFFLQELRRCSLRVTPVEYLQPWGEFFVWITLPEAMSEMQSGGTGGQWSIPGEDYQSMAWSANSFIHSHVIQLKQTVAFVQFNEIKAKLLILFKQS